MSGSCGCKHGKGKKHVHKEPGDGYYKELGKVFWETQLPQHFGITPGCTCMCHGMEEGNLYDEGECCFFCGCMPKPPHLQQ